MSWDLSWDVCGVFVAEAWDQPGFFAFVHNVPVTTGMGLRLVVTELSQHLWVWGRQFCALCGLTELHWSCSLLLRYHDFNWTQVLISRSQVWPLDQHHDRIEFSWNTTSFFSSSDPTPIHMIWISRFFCDHQWLLLLFVLALQRCGATKMYSHEIYWTSSDNHPRSPEDLIWYWHWTGSCRFFLLFASFNLITAVNQLQLHLICI